MSYQVIALKWRPQNFQNMIGQKHISQTLINALKAERLPQAMLFTGPRGTGKTSTARILAKSLRCQNAKDFVPCGECSDCKDIALGRSLDVIEIDGASNNGVDSIRELRDSVSFRPSSGDKKVYIIDEVHMLSISAFNALLKTLEEPPEHVVFILATTEVHKIPKTILSRCHRFDFRKISVADMADYLETICKAEGVAYEKEALWAIARSGQGSVRDSLSFLDQVITYSEKNITYLNVRESLGLTDRRLLIELLKCVVACDKDQVMGVLDNLFLSGTDINVIAEDLLEELKNLLIVKTSKSPKEFLDLPEVEIELLQGLSDQISEADIHLLFDMMLKLTLDLARTHDPKTVLEVGVLKLCLYPKILDLEKSLVPHTANAKRDDKNKVTYSQEAAVKLKIESKSITTKSVPKPKAVPNLKKTAQVKTQIPSKPEETPQITPLESVVVAKSANGKWDLFVEKVKRLNVKVGATLQNCHYTVSETLVQIAAPESLTFIKTDISKPEFQKVMGNYIKMFIGPEVEFKIVDNISGQGESGQSQTVSTLAKEKAEQQKMAQAELMDKIHNSDVIKNLKETFKEIEIISVKDLLKE